jgi:O-antigen/teichoic acid export membrane protein
MTKADTEARVGRAAWFGVIGQLAALIAGLWSTPELLLGLGAAAYGALAIVVSFTTYFFYLELGLGGAYIRELSAAFGTQNHERAQQLFETAHYLYLRVGLISALLMVVLGLPYLYQATQDATLLYQTWACIIATAAMLFVSMALSASRGVLFAMQRADYFSKISLWFQPTIPVAQVLLVWAGFGILGVLGVQLAGNLLSDLIYRRFTLTLQPDIIRRAKFHPEIWSDLRGFSLYRFASQVAQQGQWTGDRVLLGAMLSTERVSVYAVSASIAQRLRIFAIALNGPFFAAASERFAQDGPDGLAQMCASFWRRCAIFLAIASAGASFLSLPFLEAWVGQPYAQEGNPILQVMVISTSLLAIAGLIGAATDAAGHPRSAAVASVCGVIASLIAGGLLVLWMGPFGAALGFALGACVQLLMLSISLGLIIGARRLTRMSLEGLLAPALVGVASFVVMKWIPASSGFWGALPASIAGAIVGFLLAGISGVIRQEDLPARLQRFWTKR